MCVPLSLRSLPPSPVYGGQASNGFFASSSSFFHSTDAADIISLPLIVSWARLLFRPVSRQGCAQGWPCEGPGSEPGSAATAPLDQALQDSSAQSLN